MGLMNRVLTTAQSSRAGTSESRSETAESKTVDSGLQSTFADFKSLARTAQPDKESGSATSPPTDASHESSIVDDGPAGQLHRLLDLIETTPAGISFPGAVFEVLKAELGIRSGAILVRDFDDNRFKVWSHVGLDPTTRARMTLTHDAVAEVCPKRVTYIASGGRDALSTYLSFREASKPDPLMMIQLRNRTRLTAVLVLLDADIVSEEPSTRDVMLAAICEPIARNLEKYREQPLDRLYRPLILELQDFKRSLRASTRRIGSTSSGILVAAIDLRKITRSVQREIPSADEYHVTRDIQIIVSAVLSGAGDVCAAGSELIIAAVAMPSGEHGELLIAQLSAQIGALFPELPGRFRVPSEIRQWPIDGDNPQEIVDSLLKRRD